MNEIKVKRLLGATDIELVAPELIPKLTGAPVGFAGPVGLKQIRILADLAVKTMANFVVGGNQADTHFIDANPGRVISQSTNSPTSAMHKPGMSPRAKTAS